MELANQLPNLSLSLESAPHLDVIGVIEQQVNVDLVLNC